MRQRSHSRAASSNNVDGDAGVPPTTRSAAARDGGATPLLQSPLVSIFVVRHGETPSNAARIVQLRETPLSERGIAQAERVAARLAGVGVARILASDLTRAAMTAERIAAATGAPIAHEPLLRERDFGALCGIPYAELAFDIFAPDYLPPSGESWEVFRTRVATAWNTIVRHAAATSGNLAVVTHGLVCHVLLDRHVHCTDPAPEMWPNTSVTEVDAAAPWSVRVLNCVAHLDDERDAITPPAGRV
jgi:broad specificity phosphatase PhoE